MKCAIILPFFFTGGVERWASYIFNAIDSNNNQVDLYVLGKITASPKDFGIDIDIKKINLFSLLRIIFINKYDFYITALSKLNLFISFLCMIRGRKAITSVHLSFLKKDFESRKKYFLRKFIHKLIYYFSYKIICVSRGIYFDYFDIVKNKDKLLVIHNPCFSVSEIHTKALFDKKFINIACAGRLHFQKGFDILIDAFNLIPEMLVDNVILNLYGPDPDNLWPLLKSKIEKRLINQVFYHGSVNNLYLTLREADIFVLSSRYEGFGNVLAEALASDCFCISFNIPHGPSEILDDGAFGVLVNDITAEALSSALIDALKDSKYLHAQRAHVQRISHLYQFTSEHFYEKFSANI